MSETWRRLLADFRPVAKAAAERTEGAPQFGTNGFVQRLQGQTWLPQ